MSGPSGTRRRPAAGRLDPTVRALLRSFLSPAVADTYAAALQPIAVADRDAAIAGAVSVLRVRFGVLPEEMAIVLVKDTGWLVQDVATLLGIPLGAIQVKLQHPDALRIGPGETAAASLNETESLDAHRVAEMMARAPGLARRISNAQQASDGDAVDVEMSTALQSDVRRSSLAAQIRLSDRRQIQVVAAIVVLIIVLVGAALGQTGASDTSVVDLQLGTGATPATDTISTDNALDGDTLTPDAATQPQRASVPVGATRVAEIRFVESVDPATGEAGDAVDEAPSTTDVRIWLRLDQRPAASILLEVTFTSPDASITVRPVLLPPGDAYVAIRLPDELGRAPGRYRALVLGVDMEPAVAEVRLTQPDAPSQTATTPAG
ncbi:MAG: hypothetical protein ACI970_001125 [Myxococcota bacterium]